MACSRFWRIASALSRIAAMRFCSFNEGSLILISCIFLQTNVLQSQHLLWHEFYPIPFARNDIENFYQVFQDLA